MSLPVYVMPGPLTLWTKHATIFPSLLSPATKKGVVVLRPSISLFSLSYGTKILSLCVQCDSQSAFEVLSAVGHRPSSSDSIWIHTHKSRQRRFFLSRTHSFLSQFFARLDFLPPNGDMRPPTRFRVSHCLRSFFILLLLLS